MRLDGRRQSGNIQDRRGMSGKAIGIGGGIIGVIIAAVITFMSGGSVGDVAQSVFSAMQQGGGAQTQQAVELDAEDQRLYDLSSKVLAGTEDVWTKIFREQGWGEYKAPQMVIYSGSVQTGCGQGTAQT
ncbi:MAG: neutral zinc metallopeptidase, partial [Muribaculaceae bacterium]|nr:neutral zinc metallopeptidase [Muribaculaceae bacterium]